MATLTQTDLNSIEDTPEIRRARRLVESIENKLNFDGRYSVLTQFEAGSRFGKLTNDELDFLGKFHGWDQPYYLYIDWDNVPSNFLAACIGHPHCTNVLQRCHPAPAIKPLIEALSVDDSEAFLRGEYSLEQINHAEIPAVAIDALRDGDLCWADLVERYPSQTVLP